MVYTYSCLTLLCVASSSYNDCLINPSSLICCWTVNWVSMIYLDFSLLAAAPASLPILLAYLVLANTSPSICSIKKYDSLFPSYSSRCTLHWPPSAPAVSNSTLTASSNSNKRVFDAPVTGPASTEGRGAVVAGSRWCWVSANSHSRCQRIDYQVAWVGMRVIGWSQVSHLVNHPNFHYIPPPPNVMYIASDVKSGAEPDPIPPSFPHHPIPQTQNKGNLTLNRMSLTHIIDRRLHGISDFFRINKE